MLTEDYSLKNAQTTNTKIGKPKVNQSNKLH
jgi:hypothetical protein